MLIIDSEPSESVYRYFFNLEDNFFALFNFYAAAITCSSTYHWGQLQFKKAILSYYIFNYTFRTQKHITLQRVTLLLSDKDNKIQVCQGTQYF